MTTTSTNKVTFQVENMFTRYCCIVVYETGSNNYFRDFENKIDFDYVVICYK